MNKKKINYSRELKTGYNEYKNMKWSFSPYAMFTNGEVQTKIVNTDRLGFRKVFYKNKLIGIDDLKKNSNDINLIVGGSTAFSMGAKSDKKTIHGYLTSLGRLTFSLGVRAASGHQEILNFLKFKSFFPKIKNIVIFSGINDLSIAGSNNSIFYKDFGGLMNDFGHAQNFLLQSGSNYYQKKWIKGLTNLFFYITVFSEKSNLFKFFLSLFSYFKKGSLQRKTEKISHITLKEKFRNTNEMISNDLHTWSIIQKQMKLKIIYILQPCATWTNKPKTDFEKEIIREEKKRISSIYEKKYWNRELFIKQKKFISKSCKKNNIKFVDANELILKSDYKKNFFIDMTHLSDYGNQFMAKYIDKLLIK